jgi:REP element-mobilizing transposase RayT
VDQPLERFRAMGRRIRVQYPGAIYHVMNRGDRREPIFKDGEDYKRFLKTLAEACGKTGWQVHAYCLMLNHFHLVIETPQDNLVPGMKWFLGTYTSRFNRRHQLFGHLFSGRYKALVVDGSGDGYLRTVCDYVQLKEQLLEMMEANATHHHSAEQRRETDEQKAERLLVVEMKSRRWTEADLSSRPKTVPAKVLIAARLRSETVMTLDWLARRLHMGCRHTLANCLKLSNSRDGHLFGMRKRRFFETV